MKLSSKKSGKHARIKKVGNTFADSVSWDISHILHSIHISKLNMMVSLQKELLEDRVVSPKREEDPKL
jgi:hypothetical protein